MNQVRLDLFHSFNNIPSNAIQITKLPIAFHEIFRYIMCSLDTSTDQVKIKLLKNQAK